MDLRDAVLSLVPSPVVSVLRDRDALEGADTTSLMTLDYQFIDNAVETWHSRTYPRAGQGTRVGPVFALPGQIPE